MGNQELLLFFAGRGTDDAGRSLETVVAFSDMELEGIHDYIQWLFPTHQMSAANPNAPVVDEKIQETFRNCQLRQGNLCKACGRMLTFYGFVCQKQKGRPTGIELASDFQRKARNWLTPNNHNHLRLTRILTSLRLLGRDRCSLMLLGCLEEVVSACPARITGETVEFWRGSQKASITR